jgi:hypothetical protein
MNEKKQTAIKVFENEMRDRLCQKNDEEKLFADLTGLYVDIIGVVSATDKTKTGIIYDYAKLLEQDLQLYSGTEAYIAGRGGRDKPENEVFNGYMRRIMDIANKEKLHSRTQTLFNEIIGLLGDKNGLLTDFTETYRAVHGIIASNIHEFIRMGQTSETDMTAA